MIVPHEKDAAGSRVTVFVCATCRRGEESLDPKEARSGFRLVEAVAEAVREAGQAATVLPVECLSNCSRGCTVAFAAPGKWTYVIGDLDPAAHIADIVSFARLHADHPDGVPVWRERPAHFRKNVVARVPPLAAPLPPISEQTA